MSQASTSMGLEHEHVLHPCKAGVVGHDPCVADLRVPDEQSEVDRMRDAPADQVKGYAARPVRFLRQESMDYLDVEFGLVRLLNRCALRRSQGPSMQMRSRDGVLLPLA